ncbi:unnamed protein product [Symbiodinium sp. CCMP2592]|nr:unnamed protein product [Symbiodinium sp. CCMP2592]
MAAARFLEQVLHVRPSWRPAKIQFQHLTVACSNTVYKVACGEEKLLLRVYGSDEHGLFQRPHEVSRARYVASCGFGPQVLHTFEEGRIEQWLEGRSPTYEEIRTEESIRRIACKLREFHDRTGLNHNDLHHNNMLMTERELHLLDFEYSNSLDPTYDIANHFNEWMYPYSGPNQHLYQLGLYPSLAQRRLFCSYYLGSPRGKGAVVDDFLAQVEKRRQDSHEFWVRWADSTPSSFNSAQEASELSPAYLRSKHLQAFGRIAGAEGPSGGGQRHSAPEVGRNVAEGMVQTFRTQRGDPSLHAQCAERLRAQGAPQLGLRALVVKASNAPVDGARSLTNSTFQPPSNWIFRFFALRVISNVVFLLRHEKSAVKATAQRRKGRRMALALTPSAAGVTGYLGCLLLALVQAVEESDLLGLGLVPGFELLSKRKPPRLAAKMAGQWWSRSVLLGNSAMDMRAGRAAWPAGRKHRTKDTKKIISDPSTQASQALDSASTPVAEGALGAPAPAPPSAFVSADTLTPPPGVPGLLAFSSRVGFIHRAPVTPLQASATAPQPRESGKSKKARSTPTPTPQVQHRIAASTLALLLLASAFLGFLVVWRQAKVLLNKPRGDFREEAASEERRRLEARSEASEARGAGSSQDRSPANAALSAGRRVASLASASSGEDSPRGRDPDSLQATAKAVSGPSASSERLETEPEELEQAEADAAGGYRRP